MCGIWFFTMAVIIVLHWSSVSPSLINSAIAARLIFFWCATLADFFAALSASSCWALSTLWRSASIASFFSCSDLFFAKIASSSAFFFAAASRSIASFLSRSARSIAAFASASALALASALIASSRSSFSRSSFSLSSLLNSSSCFFFATSSAS